MPEISGIKFEYPKLLTLEYVKENGILMSDDDDTFEFRSYWEGSFNHYERLFYQDKPFSGLLYDIRPNGNLWLYKYYVGGYEEGESVDFYSDGRIQQYCYCNPKDRTLILKWNENGQLIIILERVFPSTKTKEVLLDEQGNILETKQR